MAGEPQAVAHLINNTNVLIDSFAARQDTYDDTFVNTEAKDVEVKRVNPDTGEQETILIPNVAKVKESFETWKDNVRDSIQEIRMENGVLIVDKVLPQVDPENDPEDNPPVEE